MSRAGHRRAVTPMEWLREHAGAWVLLVAPALLIVAAGALPAVELASTAPLAAVLVASCSGAVAATWPVAAIKMLMRRAPAPSSRTGRRADE